MAGALCSPRYIQEERRILSLEKPLVLPNSPANQKKTSFVDMLTAHRKKKENALLARISNQKVTDDPETKLPPILVVDSDHNINRVVPT